MRLMHSLLFGVILSLFSTLSMASAIKVTDSHGVQTFSATPQRVVVLDWDLLENMIELGVVPVGATELSAYSQWVVKPALPVGIADVGTRMEPNLEKIASLKPDVILASSSQKEIVAALEKIAPVVYFTNFSEKDNAASVAIAQFKSLSVLFNKQRLADKKLQEMAARFRQLNVQLKQHYPHGVPNVVVMRFSNPTSVFLYGENSTVQYVINQLGLKNALPQPAKQWGIVLKRLDVLKNVGAASVLYIRPFPDEAKLKKSVLWQSMSFVRTGHVNTVDPVWSYGGAMSLKYTAEAITASLLASVPTL